MQANTPHLKLGWPENELTFSRTYRALRLRSYLRSVLRSVFPSNINWPKFANEFSTGFQSTPLKLESSVNDVTHWSMSLRPWVTNDVTSMGCPKSMEIQCGARFWLADQAPVYRFIQTCYNCGRHDLTTFKSCTCEASFPNCVQARPRQAVERIVVWWRQQVVCESVTTHHVDGRRTPACETHLLLITSWLYNYRSISTVLYRWVAQGWRLFHHKLSDRCNCLWRSPKRRRRCRTIDQTWRARHTITNSL